MLHSLPCLRELFFSLSLYTVFAMTCANPGPDWLEMVIKQQTNQWPAVLLHTPVPKSKKAALSQMVLTLKRHFTERTTAKV